MEELHLRHSAELKAVKSNLEVNYKIYSLDS